MNIPSELSYTESHEWVRLSGRTATVGITDYAQDELGDIIYLEFPRVGQELTRGEPFGAIEAIKTVADLIAPVSGKVTEVNEGLNDSPEKVNQDPYGEGWIVKIELSEPVAKESFLTAEAYGQIVQ
ncbi:MAG: glycine cleavage system protein GcvH [Fidelibacterota bacterium]